MCSACLPVPDKPQIPPGRVLPRDDDLRFKMAVTAAASVAFAALDHILNAVPAPVKAAPRAPSVSAAGSCVAIPR